MTNATAPQARTPEEIRSIFASEQSTAQNDNKTRLSTERERQIQYYRSEAKGNLSEERPDKSKYVTDDVREAVEGALPDIMRLFISGDKIVVFEPVTEEDVEGAEQATDYINWLFFGKLEGYRVTMNALKDALLHGIGIVKHWHDTETHIESFERTDISTEALAMFLAPKPDREVQVTEHEAHPVMGPAGQPQMVLGMDGIVRPVVQHNVRGRIISRKSCIKMESVALNEFMINRRCKYFSDAKYVGHKSRVKRTDLLALGYDWETVMSLPDANSFQDPEESIRFRRSEEPGYSTGHQAREMDEIRVTDHLIFADLDGSGYGQWWFGKTAGENADRLLLDPETGAAAVPAKSPEHYYSIFPTIPQTHTFWSYGLADITMRYQEVRSTIIRQLLDFMNRTNNPRMGISRRAAGSLWERTYADVIANELGRPYVSDEPGAVYPIQSPAFPTEGLAMLEQFAKEKQGAGISQTSSRLNPNTQAKTATQVEREENKDMAPVELYARNYAEIGFANLFRSLLRWVTMFPNEHQIARLRGKFVSMDPTTWNPDMDTSAQVGLGTMASMRTNAMFDNILQKQTLALQAGYPGMNWEYLFNTMDDWGQANGIVNIERYFPDPTEAPPKPPKPDPAVMLAQSELEDKKNDRIKIMTDDQNTKRDQWLEAQKNGIAAAKVAAEVERDRAQLAESYRETNVEAYVQLAKEVMRNPEKVTVMHEEEPGNFVPGPETVQ